MAEKKLDERRRYLRYPPDATEVVLLQFSRLGKGEFRAELAALPTEESRTGLRLVVLRREPLEGVEEGADCVAKVARLGPQPAVVRWLKFVDDEIALIGLELLSE